LRLAAVKTFSKIVKMTYELQHSANRRRTAVPGHRSSFRVRTVRRRLGCLAPCFLPQLLLGATPPWPETGRRR
jgi:hypothetical protein